jgi:NitT/TauT family transport system substrate-binding protein
MHVRLLLLVLALWSGTATAQDAIVVSHPPASPAALPLFIAREKGWWREAGLAPRFVPYAAGSAQVAGAGARDWDVGVVGAVATVLGTAMAELRLVAVANDEAPGHVLVARGEDAALIAQPQTLRGKQVFVTLNSAAELVLLGCIRRWNVRREDLTLVNLAPPQIVTAFTVGNGSAALLWSPYQYLLADRVAVQPLCSGRDAGVMLPGGIVARAAFAREQPALLARFVAVYLRGIAWQRANAAEAAALMGRFAEAGGTPLPSAALPPLLEANVNFVLDEQLRLFARTGNQPAPLERAFTTLATYLRNARAIRELPNPREVLSDATLRAIAADERLRTLATTP